MKKYFIKVLKILIIVVCLVNSTIVYGSNDNDEPSVYSDSAILIDFKTGTVLYSKNSEDKMYPASTTKILTAIIAIEKCNLNEIVTVSKSSVSAIPEGYSSAYLSEGEQISVKDLLTVFLVHSANDAGYVLAEHISGSIQEFANLMNEKASEIGCKNTNFTNPSGIHDDNHYSTAHDLALIARYCMTNSVFRNIVSQKTCTINATNKFGVRSYKNTNDLINPTSKYYMEDCIGIKTGYTRQAKNCLISSCLKNNLILICVVLGANPINNIESSRYEDSINLFNYGYSNYSIKTFVNENDTVKNVEIKNGSKNANNLDLISKDALSGLIGNSDALPTPVVTLKSNISAPIAKGTVLGTVSYTSYGITYSSDLIAASDIEKNDTTLIMLYIALAFILIIILIVVLIFILIHKKNKKSL